MRGAGTKKLIVAGVQGSLKAPGRVQVKIAYPALDKTGQSQKS